jgi:hypothetical protein
MAASRRHHRSGTESEYGGFFICRTCYYLVETHAPEGMGQLCRCGDRGQQPVWEGFDFNERVILCNCCAQEALKSGSRWSPYFCRECQTLVKEASIRQGRLIVPIGRHTLMHTWVPKAVTTSRDGPLSPADEADEILATMETIVDRYAHLSRWYQTTVARSLTALGIQGDVLLHHYLEALTSSHQAGKALPTRFELFRGLCEHFQQVQPRSEAESGPSDAGMDVKETD